MRLCIALCVCLGIVVTGCDVASTMAPVAGGEAVSATALNAGKTIVQTSQVQIFDPAGPFGGGVLTPGTYFPPTKGGRSTIRRGNGWVNYSMHTTGLPPGAYTNWWVIFNNRHECIGPCDIEDLFNPDADPSVFWATGKVVQANGVGNFRARIHEGEAPSSPDQFVLGNPDGLTNAEDAEIHIIVKYHGPASDDRDVLYEQMHTILGSCETNANAYDFGPPFGVQCFDPQFAAHTPD